MLNASPFSRSPVVALLVSHTLIVIFSFSLVCLISLLFFVSLVQQAIHGIHLAAALRVNATVTNLDISDNMLRSLATKALLDALITHPSLTHLSIQKEKKKKKTKRKRYEPKRRGKLILRSI